MACVDEGTGKRANQKCTNNNEYKSPDRQGDGFAFLRLRIARIEEVRDVLFFAELLGGRDEGGALLILIRPQGWLGICHNGTFSLSMRSVSRAGRSNISHITCGQRIFTERDLLYEGEMIN